MLVIGLPHFRWLLYDGLLLNATGRQRLLQQKLVPFFTHYYTEWGDSPRVAASHAARAAAMQSRSLSCGGVVVSVIIVYIAVGTFAYMAVSRFLRALHELSRFKRSE
ncbi:hypothetical protein ABPG75_007139 [Micractinium tetrahymenae]